jgi:tetratricopeptide (TPR) repeat protein
MKRYINEIITMALVLLATGCSKYLEVKPKGIDVPATIDQFNGLFNNSLLTELSTYQMSEQSFSPGENANLSIFLSDEAFTTAPYNSALRSSYQQAYRWEPQVYQADQNAAEWSAFYQHIYTYNVIAANVMNAIDGTELRKKQLLAEARANRAFLHLMVLNYFGKPYNAATAASDPGIPLITAPAASGRSGPRASVQEVYDFVTGELKASIPDLPEQTVNRLRLYKPAAEYMLGQAYFYMGKYDSALTWLKACQQLLPSGSAAMELYDYNVVMPQWIPPFPNFPPSVPNFSINTEEICQRQMVVGNFRGTVFLDPDRILYDSSDLRLKFFTRTDFSGSTIYPYWCRSGPFRINYGPSLPDLYLMLAECKARLGDISGGNADLVTLRLHRMPAAKANVAISDQAALIRFIVEERYREYALTGKNWFDVRRLWHDPLFQGRTYTHTDNGGVYTLKEDRLVLKIPPLILGFNPDMPDNP